jgi:hypothetical protein
MSEARIDRLLAAALHQAIGDVTPPRLEFYEGYLKPRGWRDDSVNLAPLAAVLSFLRHEPPGTYDDVMTGAAAYAAAWVYDGLPWHVRARRRVTPRRLRLRQLARIGRQHVERGYRGTKVALTVRRGVLTADILGSIFCNTRDHAGAPHCRYYQAFFEQLLAHDGLLAGESRIDACRAGGGDVCRLHIELAAATAPALASTLEGVE